ncbi:MAG: hypothetical protein V1918_09480 [Planctomycetota bacterium]
MSRSGLFGQTADIERATPSVNGAGEVVLAWSAVASGVPCALQPLRARSRLDRAGEALRAEAALYLPSGTDLRPRLSDGHADRVTVEGGKYLVESVTEDDAGRGRLRVALLVREA